jgi:hypothetical protein
MAAPDLTELPAAVESRFDRPMSFLDLLTPGDDFEPVRADEPANHEFS